MSDDKAGVVCYPWETYWPHPPAMPGLLRTDVAVSRVTCPTCLHTLGSQKYDPPLAHGQTDETPLAAEKARRFVPPFGWPLAFRVVTVTPADRQRRLIVANRYPRQIIGIAIRLPDDATQNRIDRNTGKRFGHHRSLSIVWSKPARWWKR